MAAEFTTTLFTPSQAVKITGMSVASQRDLRRHGYLRKHDGHARFDCMDLAEMALIHEMSQRGVGPKETSSIAKVCAARAVYSSLGERHAYEGPLPPLHEALGNLDRWKGNKDHLRRRFLTSRGYPYRSGKFFVWWASGEELWCEFLDSAFDSMAFNDPKISGPVIVMDLDSLGKRLLEKAGAPFIDLASLVGDSAADTPGG